MGLLDDLQFGSGGYTGQNGGLLDMLQNYRQQMQMQPGAGFTYGANEYNPIDAAGQSQQQAATLPQNAQPAVGQMPEAQPEGPNRFMTGLEGFITNAHNGPIGALLGGLSGAITGQSESGSRNQTQALLVQKGMDPGIAKLVTQNPELLKAVLPHLMGTAGQTDDIKEFEYAKKQGYKGTLTDWMTVKKGAGTAKYGLSPVYGIDAKGNPSIVQLGADGNPIQPKLPEGFQIARDPIKVDGPTGTTILDPQTRQTIQFIPKDLRGAEQQKAVGEAEGKAAATLPSGVIEAEATKTKIDDLLKNEGLDSIVGPIDQFRPSWTMGAQGRDALARYNQLKGTAFLQAFATLKGGGAITEVEGTKAESAIARMDRAQSEQDFKLALTDFRDAIDTGMKKLRAAAGPAGQLVNSGTPVPANATSAPAQTLKDKYGLK